MASDPVILGFDTSAAHCAAALLSGGQVLASRAEEMGRGQAERLIPLLEEILSEAGVTWSDLDRIGVGVGPGNFTGIRISVAAARGLALGLEVPAIGVSGFEIVSTVATGEHLPAIPAPREQLYILPPGGAPALVSRAQAEAMGRPVLGLPPPAKTAEIIARIAGRAADTTTPPAPLYLKPADAAPARDVPPVILDA